MPQLRTQSPAPLEELCLLAVIRCLETDLILCEVAKGLHASSLLLRRRDLNMTRITEELKEYLAYLPGTLSEMVRQKITNRVLRKYARMTQRTPDNAPWVLPLHTKTVRLLEIVLDDDVQTFDLSEFQPNLRTPQFRPHPGEPEVWEMVLGRCSGLRKFCLPPLLASNLAINMSPFIRNLARQCNKLTEVVLKDAVWPLEGGCALSALGKHCSFIRVLDLTGSPVTCMDLLYLVFPEALAAPSAVARVKRHAMQPKSVINLTYHPLCETMRELILTNTKVRELGAYFALKFMPNLTSLGDLVHAASGLEKYFQEMKQKSSLKKIFYRGRTMARVRLIGATCPDLEALHLGSDEAKRLNLKWVNMRKLYTTGGKEHLTLEELFVNAGVHADSKDQKQYLTKLTKLRSLTLEVGHCTDIGPELNYITHLRQLQLHIPNVDLGLIAESCPLLEKLVVTLEPKKTVTLTAGNDQPILTNLQEIQFECQVSLDAAALFLTRAYQLRVVKLVRIKKLTDIVLADWLQLNPLEHLETWLLGYSQLTVVSVSLLLTRCPCLSTLGRLSGWDVRSWESRRLQRIWRSYQLNLVHFSHKQNDASQVMDATASSDEEQDWT